MPAGIVRMTPAASPVEREYRELTKFTHIPKERIAIWTEHCERSHRAEAKGWLWVLAVLAIVAAFFVGFATAALELVK